MGWSFEYGASKEKVVADLLAPWTPNEKIVSCVALKSKLTKEGAYSVLWALWEQATTEKTEKYIACYLISSQKGVGYGYKDMCESMGPCYYSCPVAWFDEVPVASAEWRANVIKAQAEKKAAAERYKAVKLGATYALKGCKIPSVMIRMKKGASWIGEYCGKNYRIPKSLLGDLLVDIAA